MASNADGQPASDGASETVWEALGITPLMEAARFGDLDACGQSLGSGATVDTAGASGWTVLLGAAAEGHESIVQLHLDHGADADARSNDNSSAMHEATAKGMPGQCASFWRLGLMAYPGCWGRSLRRRRLVGSYKVARQHR